MCKIVKFVLKDSSTAIDVYKDGSWDDCVCLPSAEQRLKYLSKQVALYQCAVGHPRVDVEINGLLTTNVTELRLMHGEVQMFIAGNTHNTGIDFQIEGA